MEKSTAGLRKQLGQVRCCQEIAVWCDVSREQGKDMVDEGRI